MSKLAQALIEKEKEEKTGYLDLGRCGLREMPDLSGMDWLETLVLSNRWWDWEKNTWLYSQNRWKSNAFDQIDARNLSVSLTKIVLSGYNISDVRFLEKLTQLRTLDLSYNRISDGFFLEKLTKLTTLDLNYNYISDGRFLEKLIELRNLFLCDNRISNWFFFENLTELRSLNLSENSISDGRFLENLPQLRNLHLNNNIISDWRFLENLPTLKSLYLGDNSIVDWFFWDNLSELQILDLRENRISDCHFLEKLTKLQSLNLSANRISDGYFLKKMTQLENLNLSDNKIIEWSFLENLPQLQRLGLRNNLISDGRFLENLLNLQSLDLSSNRINNGYFLSNLTQLQSLNLSSNNINDGRFLTNLTQLESLDLSSNSISNGHYLENLSKLQRLDLRNNLISDGSFLKNLNQLQSLDLSDNRIRDGAFLKRLNNLNQIDLSSNRIKDLNFLSLFFREKEMQVVWKDWQNIKYWEINIKDNPLENPPPEIVEQGNIAIIEYFRQKQEKGISLLNEAKLILLGDGRAGKTSLANRMLGKDLPKEADRTQGVDIVIGEYTFSLQNDKEFKLHIWDFAGQDKYKPLHQFFYTEGAVYVLVVDSGNAGTDYDDWFQTAQLFGEGSPILVVLNEFRDGIGLGLYDPEYWQKRFPGLLKEHFLVNLKTQKNLEPLKKAIHFQAQNLPHTQVAYPKNWAAIRQELELLREENFISFKEYLNICKANGLPEKESALILSGVLHRIGVCLHYQQSELLHQHVILKNEWATEAVYKILIDFIVAEQKKGFFDWNDLRRIWSDEGYSEMRPQLLELMQQFKMAYPLPNSLEFVAPPLLPPVPRQGWEFPAGEALELYVEYEFLPKAMLTQFIVSRHKDIDEGRTLVWRNGVVLRWPDALAQVEKTKFQGRDAFSIRCQGSSRKGLLTAILKTFRDLHSEYKGIKVNEIVPCPCSTCQNGKKQQHYFEFENLKNRLERGRRVVECDKSLEEVKLVHLLGDLLLFEHLTPGQPLVMRQNVRNEQLESEVQSPAPLAFFSYSKQDIKYLKEFQKHLRPLERSGKIRLWDDLKIRPGEEWDEEIQKNLAASDIIFLLLSPDFLATEYIMDVEMQEALRRHEAGTAKVIPIKVRPSGWKDTIFSKLQGLPRKDTVISTSPDRDGTWVELIEEIKGIIEEWNKNK